jgi:ParB-like chromosome segregation protein Spo0J
MSVSPPIEPKEQPPSDAYEINEVTLTDIRVFKRLRPLEPALVEALAASMKEEGLRHPIAVRRTAEGYHLILGRHRLEAARQLKWQTIRASIFFDMTAEQAALVEVEGNLVSRLAPDEYANFVAAREEATEDRRDWKTAARRFFGLSKGDTAV